MKSAVVEKQESTTRNHKDLQAEDEPLTQLLSCYEALTPETPFRSTKSISSPC